MCEDITCAGFENLSPLSLQTFCLKVLALCSSCRYQNPFLGCIGAEGALRHSGSQQWPSLSCRSVVLLLTLSLIQEKNMAGSFSWQKLKLLKVQLLLPRTLGTKGWVDGNRLLWKTGGTGQWVRVKNEGYHANIGSESLKRLLHRGKGQWVSHSTPTRVPKSAADIHNVLKNFYTNVYNRTIHRNNWTVSRCYLWSSLMLWS